jgi:hypothetical protein
MPPVTEDTAWRAVGNSDLIRLRPVLEGAPFTDLCTTPAEEFEAPPDCAAAEPPEVRVFEPASPAIAPITEDRSTVAL